MTHGGQEGVSGAIRRIFVNTGWLAASKIVGAVLSIVYLAIATRTLGVEQFGRFALILATGQLVATIVKFDTWQAVVKFGQKPLQAGDKMTLGGLVSISAATDLAGAVMGMLLAAAVIFLGGPYLRWSTDMQYWAFGYTLVLLFAVRATPMGVLRLLDRFDAGAISETMVPVARLLGAVFALWLRPDILGFLIAWAISEAIGSLSYWWLAYHHGRGSVGPVDASGLKGKFAKTPGFFRFAIATNLSATLGAVTSQGPLLLLGLYVGETAAGLYRLAQQLANALGKITSLFSRALFAEMARSHERGDHDTRKAELRAIARFSSRLGMGSGLLITVLIVTLGKFILGTMSGAAYLPAYPILLLLGIAGAVDMMGSSYEPLLLAANRVRQSVMIRLAMTLSLVGLLFWLMPVYGTQGAATAVLTIAVLGFIARALAARRI